MKRGLKNTLLAMLGFSAAPMLTACYGIAYDLEYSYVDVEGTVTDEKYKPIEGIRVAVGGNVYTEGADMVYTDADGKFHLTTYGLPTLTAEDVDGDKNGGSFSATTRKIASEADRKVVIVMKKAE